jgi:hypothetical protein
MMIFLLLAVLTIGIIADRVVIARVHARRRTQRSIDLIHDLDRARHAA